MLGALYVAPWVGVALAAAATARYNSRHRKLLLLFRLRSVVGGGGENRGG